MQGRWTIYVCPVCGHAGGADECAGPRDHHELISRPAVPVVPCDDAAMTRAVNAALAEMLRLLAADDFDDEREGDESPEWFVARKAMEAGFRAAGETP